MEIPNTDLELMAFYEIARRANLTGHPDLMKSPAFLRVKELHDAKKNTLARHWAARKPSTIILSCVSRAP